MAKADPADCWVMYPSDFLHTEAARLVFRELVKFVRVEGAKVSRERVWYYSIAIARAFDRAQFYRSPPDIDSTLRESIFRLEWQLWRRRELGLFNRVPLGPFGDLARPVSFRTRCPKAFEPQRGHTPMQEVKRLASAAGKTMRDGYDGRLVYIVSHTSLYVRDLLTGFAGEQVFNPTKWDPATGLALKYDAAAIDDLARRAIVECRALRGRPSEPMMCELAEIIQLAARDLAGLPIAGATVMLVQSEKPSGEEVRRRGRVHGLIERLGTTFDLQIVTSASDDRMRKNAKKYRADQP